MSGRDIAESALDADGVALRIRNHFLGWQCRIRQLSVRQRGGRPSAGMCPRVLVGDRPEALGDIVVVIVKREPEAVVAQFRHLVRKTHDPADRYNGALRFLSAAYYQHPAEFSDRMTALFGLDSSLVSRLLGTTRCVLEFAQYQQRYRIRCAVRELANADPAYQATYWHNCMFNAEMPGRVRVLSFAPDWRSAEAEPPVLIDRGAG